MGIGLGVVLLVAGLVLVTDAVTLDLDFVQDTTLGWILMLGGVVAIAATLAMARGRSDEVVHRSEAPPR